MSQQGQVFPLTSGSAGATRWAYRYRTGGRVSRRVQRGGFATEQAAVEALERALERLRRERGLVETPTLAEFVERSPAILAVWPPFFGDVSAPPTQRGT